MAELARSAGVMFHTDAVQAVGKLPIRLKETAIDMLSLSGHKLHAPKGVGVLYLRRGVRFRPLLRGGHQERGRRAGTENTASSGSACTSGSLEPSHVMRAMGIPLTAAHGTIRFSLSRYNRTDEIETVVGALPSVVAQLRRLSPYWGEQGPVQDPQKAFAPAYA
jgi:cysteine sulfinate desulfinase/cysteine desulfurase-like protein